MALPRVATQWPAASGNGLPLDEPEETRPREAAAEPPLDPLPALVVAGAVWSRPPFTQTLNWSASSYYADMGFTHRMQQVKHWLAQREGAEVEAYNQAAAGTTAKTASSVRYAQRAALLFSHMAALQNFWVERKRARRLEFWTYRRSQQALAHACARIGGGPAAGREVLVAYGDASWGRVPGNRVVGKGRLLRALQERFTVVMVDEFRTSKCCSACFGGMSGARIDGVTSYRVRRCNSPICCDQGRRPVLPNTVDDGTRRVSGAAGRSQDGAWSVDSGAAGGGRRPLPPLPLTPAAVGPRHQRSHQHPPPPPPGHPPPTAPPQLHAWHEAAQCGWGGGGRGGGGVAGGGVGGRASRRMGGPLTPPPSILSNVPAPEGRSGRSVPPFANWELGI